MPCSTNAANSVKAILDANRNSLMLLELRFSVCTLGLGAGTFLAALYGMNLKNFIEESDLGFWGVSGFSVAVSVVVLMYGLGRLRRVQRVSMWGECGPERGLGLAKRGIKENMKAVEEERSSRRLWSWGLGRGTAAAGLGPVGHTSPPVTEYRERVRKVVGDGEKRGHFPQQHGHWPYTRRRKFAHPEGETTSTGGIGNTTSGLGNGKPPGGNTA
jgi:hypothetical protein